LSAAAQVPNRTDDRSLLERLRHDDTTAFDEIFRTWYAPLVRVADAMVHSRAIAEELVQDVMLELWRRRDRLAPDGSPQAYLFQATRNRALNHLRHGRIVERSAPFVAGESTARPSPEDRTDARVAEAELQAALREAVASLPPRCRQVFELSRVEGLKYGEIAERLGVTVKAVEALMGRALRALRERLAAWLPESDTL
jgi:RNA polymerase sigma-70 factor (ECF subfamily)